MTHTSIKLPIQKVHHFFSRSSASALIITQGADRKVILQAGSLSEHAFQSAAESLSRYWKPSLRDINRYVGLFLDNSFYILYAKYLSQGGCVLGLVFRSKIPLVRIRQDMTVLVRMILDDQPNLDETEKPLERSLQSNHHTQHEEHKDREVMADWIHSYKQTIEESVELREDGLDFFKPSKDLGLEISSPQDRAESDGFAGDVPWQLINLEQRGQAESQPKGRTETQKGNAWQPLNDLTSQGEDLASILHGDFDLRDPSSGLNAWMISEDAPKNVFPEEDSVQPEITLISDKVEAEASPELIKVSDITIYLAPRRNDHNLVGDLDRQLRSWLPEICTYYGWGLGSITVRADYLRWTLKDFPEVLIQDMLQIIRKQTSGRIFSTYPEYQKGSVSEDFWAPGYLVDTQNKAYSTSELLVIIAPNRLNR